MTSESRGTENGIDHESESILRPPPSSEASSVLPLSDFFPINLPIIPVTQAVVFPGMVVPVLLTQEKHKEAVKAILEKNESPYIGIVVTKDPDAQDVNESTLLHYGVAGRIIKKINIPDGNQSVLLNCMRRFQIRKIYMSGPVVMGQVAYKDDQVYADAETDALTRAVIQQFKLISQDNPMISDEIRFALSNVDGPGRLSDLISSILIKDPAQYEEFLATTDVKQRLEKVLRLLKREIEVYNLQQKLQTEINNNFNKTQRDYFLNEQLKLIKKELGSGTNEKEQARTKFLKRLEGKTISEEVQKRFDEEIERLETLSDQSAEYSVSYNYMDWLTSIPWGVFSQESHDLRNARRILAEDHYGLTDVKKRILEFIAVRKLKNNTKGGIICLVGPPGVGKTSLGKSIARTLNRPFYRFSVGGMRDEAEIKGHRRTYIGAMPGKIIQGIKKTGVMNPVFMIDEIDKLGSDFRGDPASALLEALDPEQNIEFMDHYLDVNTDISNVLFVCTANQLDTIPGPLLDRMEVIRLAGYILDEKLAIAEQYLMPRQLDRNGLTTKDVVIPRKLMAWIIDGYARESGVRTLEKQIEKICRARAMEKALGQTKPQLLMKKDLERYLGVPLFDDAEAIPHRAGVCAGLAWTSMGGETLTIECVNTPAKEGNLKLTGQLGNVMSESANIAWSYVKKLVSKNPKKKDFFEKNQVHLHIPAGAIPKDGPSAGITMAASLYSLSANKKVKPRTAMTGELTLTGQVLPVGGIREKIVAARRNGYKRIILPEKNKRDLKELPASVKRGMQFYPVKTFNEVIAKAF